MSSDLVTGLVLGGKLEGVEPKRILVGVSYLLVTDPPPLPFTLDHLP